VQLSKLPTFVDAPASVNAIRCSALKITNVPTSLVSTPYSEDDSGHWVVSVESGQGTIAVIGYDFVKPPATPLTADMVKWTAVLEAAMFPVPSCGRYQCLVFADPDFVDVSPDGPIGRVFNTLSYYGIGYQTFTVNTWPFPPSNLYRPSPCVIFPPLVYYGQTDTTVFSDDQVVRYPLAATPKLYR
jgi:hypothetical protein